MSRIVIGYKKKLGKLESPLNINVHVFKNVVPANHVENKVIPWRVYREENPQEEELKNVMKLHERNASMILLVILIHQDDVETKSLIERLSKATILNILHSS